MSTQPWPENTLQQLQHGLAILQMELSCEQQSKLLNHCQQLATWNKKINLTSITAPEAMLKNHILDSLSIAPYIHGDNILDVGSGGGFPGIPLAIAFPNKNFTLLDSSHKKCGFLRHIVHSMKLNNVKINQHRVHSFSSDICFDTIVARAWSSLKDMSYECSHLLCKNGKLLNMKGKYPSTELEEIVLPYQVHAIKVPGLTAARHLIVMQRNTND